MACKPVDDSRDALAFDLALQRSGGFGNARLAYSQHFKMEQDEWEGGWGWNKEVHNRPFGKMLAAGYLLERGIGAFPESRNSVWSRAALPAPPVAAGATLPLAEPICPLKVRQPTFVADDGREFHIELSHALVTTPAGSLMHYYETPTVDASGVMSLQMVQSDATAAAGPGPAVFRICALADEAVPSPGEPAWCLGADGRPAAAGAVDRAAFLWVFGRSAAGEVLVYYIDWYAAAPQWRAVDLSAVLAIVGPGIFLGRDEIPAVIKQGTPASRRIDVVVRSGYSLYHMWHEGSNADTGSGWQAEDVSAQFAGFNASAGQLEAHARPALTADSDGRRFHVFARNRQGALMQYTYVPPTTIDCGNLPFPTIVTCSLPVGGYWLPRNVDNEVEGRSLLDAVPRGNAAGAVTAVTANSGEIHVFQRKTDGRRGLFHYVLESNVWRRDEWWPETTAESLVGNPCIVANDQPALRPEDFPFDLYITAEGGGALLTDRELYGFQYLQGTGEWWRENIGREALPIGLVPSLIPTGVSATLTRFEQWTTRNVVGTARTPGLPLARYTWSERTGWHADALPTAGWRSELIPGSDLSRAVPALNDFERVLDVYTFTAGEFVRHRLTRDRPWHMSGDYFNWASGQKHGFDYEPLEEFDDPASAGKELDWHVWMECRSFDGGNDSHPTFRASAMLHEATHVNEHYRGTFNPWAHVDVDGEDMDPWHWHALWGVPPGGLDPTEHTHSMYQIEIEFDADLGEFPAPQLPFALWGGWTLFARSRMTDRILTIPPWTPGLPRPLL